MRKFCLRGVVFFAGIVSIPGPVFAPVAKMGPPGTEIPRERTDGRLKALREYFKKLNCPAFHYAHEFLAVADRYSLDWRLLPSISVVESAGGKSTRNNNLFGWDSGKAKFATLADSIHMVGKRLAHSRLYKGRTLDEKLAIYNPKRPEYAARVKSVMRQIAPAQ